jgi:hypothetical protein
MQDHHEAKDLPGYNPGSREVAKSPITLDELKELKGSCLFTDEDVVYLRLSYDVLKDQAEDLVAMWRGIVAQQSHLARYGLDRKTGEPDTDYSAAVGKRFAQWVLDTARGQYDQEWLDYQYEIGLRHHRAKKNLTYHAHTAAHIRGRDLSASLIDGDAHADAIASADGTKLYASIGSNSNVGENGIDAEKERAAIWEIDIASGHHRVYASDLRNPVGMAIDPNTGALWPW